MIQTIFQTIFFVDWISVKHKKGANIALEYDTAEAEKLLSKNKTEAKRKIDEIKSELDFLSEQILISEMSKARIVSWADKNEK